VPGEGGLNLTRSAMEAATDEYMRFGAIREMHERKAAGIALSATWDERGVKLRSKIVDPVARLKVEEGVYKGYSVGVNPTLMMDKTVEKLLWVETSLVDRPKDVDAIFTHQRAEDAALVLPAEQPAAPEARADTKPEGEYGSASDAGYADPGYQDDKKPRYPLKEGGSFSEKRVRAAWSYINQADNASAYSQGDLAKIKSRIKSAAKEVGIEISEEDRAQDATSVPMRENLEPGKCPVCGKACQYCAEAMSNRAEQPIDQDTQQSEPAPVQAEVAQEIGARSEETAAIGHDAPSQLPGAGDGGERTDDAPSPPAGDVATIPAPPPAETLTRLEERATLAETRLATAQAEVERLTTALSAAEERADTLANSPVPVTPPIRYWPQNLSREHYMARGNEALDLRKQLEEERASLEKMPPAVGDIEEQRRRATRLYDLNRQLFALNG